MSAATQAPTELFYFGAPERRLFGALHEAQTYAQRESGIVICYPFGPEYIRSHRACRLLALRLSQAGFPTLRFDYGGSGDSAGAASDVTLADWRDDLCRAIGTLRDRTGVESVCLAGLRLGASLAFEVAAERSDVTSVILWEPIVAGGDYLAELAEQHRELLWRFFDDAARLSSGCPAEYLGTPVSVTLRGELERLNLLTLPAARAEHVLIVESQDSPEIALLRDQLRNAGRAVAYQSIPSFATWREDVDKGLVPEPVLRAIAAWADEVLP